MRAVAKSAASSRLSLHEGNVIDAKEKIDRAATLVLTVGVAVATAILIEGRINPRPPTMRPTERVEFVKDWRDRVAASAVNLGDSEAPVQVVVFTDFACPFCKRLDSVLRVVEAQLPVGIARSVVHFPVAAGDESRNAALAFECASEQGRAPPRSSTPPPPAHSCALQVPGLQFSRCEDLCLSSSKRTTISCLFSPSRDSPPPGQVLQ